jgi:hypothetical protein
MYKLTPNNLLTNQPSNVVYRIHDETWIPFDPANRDFQEYQEWIALGNQPLPADEQPSS